MSKSNFLTNLIFVFALASLLIFPHLFLSAEIDLMKNEERNLQAEVKAKNDKLERLIERELKSVINEERIVKIAKDSLGLQRSLKPFEQITIDKNRLELIENIVEKEYE